MQRCLIALLGCLFFCSIAKSDELVVRAETSTEQAWLGQRVILQVDVLAADAWAQVVSFDGIEVPGAYVLLPRGQGIRLRETINGTSYTGQRYELSIYPQRAGDLQLVSQALEVRIRQLGFEGTESRKTVTLPPLGVSARVPPGIEGVNGLISTHDLKADQQWEPRRTELEVGDSIRRTIKLRAAEVPGMAFPPLHYSQIDGLGVYPAEGQVDDEYNRGTLTGTRTETVTYVAERSGRFTLPTIKLLWWDTDSEQSQLIELPGTELSVKSSSTAPVLSDPVDGWADLLTWWSAVLLLLIVALVLLRRSIFAHCKLWLQKRAQSEARYFRTLLASLRSGQAKQIYNDLMRWLDRIDQSGQPARLDVFLGRYSTAQALAEFESLPRGLTDTGKVKNRKVMIETLRQARKHWQRSVSHTSFDNALLPALNHSVREH